METSRASCCGQATRAETRATSGCSLSVSSAARSFEVEAKVAVDLVAVHEHDAGLGR